MFGHLSCKTRLGKSDHESQALAAKLPNFEPSSLLVMPKLVEKL